MSFELEREEVTHADSIAGEQRRSLASGADALQLGADLVLAPSAESANDREYGECGDGSRCGGADPEVAMSSGAGTRGGS